MLLLFYFIGILQLNPWYYCIHRVFSLSSALPIWAIVSSASVKKLRSSVSKSITSCSWFSSLCWNSLTLLRLCRSSCNSSRNLCLALLKRVDFFCFQWLSFFNSYICVVYFSLSIKNFCFLFLPIIEYLKLRSSRPDVFCKKGVLRNFVKFTGKRLRQSIFLNKVAGLRPPTLLRKKPWRRCFHVKLVKFLKGRIHCETFLSRHFMKY